MPLISLNATYIMRHGRVCLTGHTVTPGGRGPRAIAAAQAALDALNPAGYPVTEPTLASTILAERISETLAGHGFTPAIVNPTAGGGSVIHTAHQTNPVVAIYLTQADHNPIPIAA